MNDNISLPGFWAQFNGSKSKQSIFEACENLKCKHWLCKRFIRVVHALELGLHWSLNALIACKSRICRTRSPKCCCAHFHTEGLLEKASVDKSIIACMFGVRNASHFADACAFEHAYFVNAWVSLRLIAAR